MLSSNKPSGSFVLLQQTRGGKPSITGTFKQHGGEITSCLDTHEPPGFSKQMVEVEEEEAEQLQQCRQRVEDDWRCRNAEVCAQLRSTRKSFLTSWWDYCVCVWESLCGMLILTQQSCNKSSLHEGQTAGSDSALWLFWTIILLLLLRLLSFIKMERTNASKSNTVPQKWSHTWN